MALLEPPIVETVTDNFEAYMDSMNGYGTESPQKQGIETPEEYAQVLGDSRSIVADVGGAAVPVMFPATYNGWLNVEHIAREGNTTPDSVLVLHATEKMTDAILPEVGDTLKDHIQSGGIISIDYPSTDSGYIERAMGRIVDLGVSPDSFEYRHLASQTYFAGVLRPNDDADFTDQQKSALNAAPRDRLQAIFAGFDSGFVSPDIWEQSEGSIRLEPHLRMPAELARSSFGFVSAAFETIQDHPCRQGWSPEEYLDMAENTPSVTKVTASEGGDALAVMAFGAQLDDFPWVNQQYYEHMYPEELSSGRLIYFPTVARSPESKSLDAMAELVRPSTAGLLALGNEVVICFDACDDNKRFLPVLISGAVRGTGMGRIKFEEIAHQDYGIFVPKA